MQMSASGRTTPNKNQNNEERKEFNPMGDMQMKNTVVAPAKRARKPKTPQPGDKPKRERKPREPKEKVVRSRTPINNMTRKVVHAVQNEKSQKLEANSQDKDYKILFGDAKQE